MNQPTITELDKDKIIAQVARMSKIAQESRWKYDYDEEVDSLVFGVEEMPNDSFLLNVNNELNLFLTPKSELKGIFIEYFATNYLQHNKDINVVMNLFKDPPKPRTEDAKMVELAEDLLESRLANGAVESLLGKDKLVTALM